MTARGRKPTPTHLKLVTGNPGRRPLNKAEAKAPPARTMKVPAHLGADAIAEWDRIAADLIRSGLITALDTSALAAYCGAVGRWVQAERILFKAAEADPMFEGLVIRTTSGNVVMNPLVGIRNKAQADVLKAAAELGITPSARSRVQAQAPEEEDDPFF